MTRRQRRCSTLLSTLVLGLPLVGAALAAPAAAAAPDPVAGAAGWLSTQFVDATHLPTPTGDHFDSKYGSQYYPNYGENADVLFGLAAAKAGADKAGVALDYLDAHLADYADTAGSFGGPYDGSVAKVALAHLVAGRNADNLLATLKDDECAPASTKCTPGAPANIFASASASFVILAEARAGGTSAPSADAVDYFLSLQCDNGGFTTGTTACGAGDADIDATSYAIMALQALGGHASELGDAADWLQGQRAAGGYWVSQGVPNANSTGLAAAALAGAGRTVDASRAWLLSQQIAAGKPGAGALKYGGAFTPTTTSATSPSVLATAQALLALTDDGSLATVSAAGSDDGVTLLAPVSALSSSTATSGTPVTATGTGFAAGERVDATLASQPGDVLGHATANASGVVTVRVAIPSSAAPGADVLVLTSAASGLETRSAITIAAAPPSGSAHEHRSGTSTGSPTAGSPPLANTGTDSAGLLPIGLLSLFAGIGIVLVAQQRRRGRHAA